MDDGTAGREEGIARVTKAADEAWKARAYEGLVLLASQRPRFNTDPLWFYAGPCPGDARAMAAVIRKAQAAGLIRPTNEWTLSRRPECHRRPLRIWEVCRGTETEVGAAD